MTTQESISSSSNPTVKHLRKLASQTKYRAQLQQTIAHGPHLGESYLQTEEAIELYYLANSALDNPEIEKLVQLLQDRNVRGILLPDNLYEALSDVHARVGLSLVIPTPVIPNGVPIVSERAILLDTVQDPGNLGTILRTARATGIKSIYLSQGSTSAWAPKALRAGMGAQFGLSIYEGIDLVDCIRTSAVPIYATTLASDSISLYDEPLASDAAWILGSEGGGVHTILQQLASKRIHLPQIAEGVESLNVSAAAAVCLYEQFRQHYCS